MGFGAKELSAAVWFLALGWWGGGTLLPRAHKPDKGSALTFEDYGLVICIWKVCFWPSLLLSPEISQSWEGQSLPASKVFKISKHHKIQKKEMWVIQPTIIFLVFSPPHLLFLFMLCLKFRFEPFTPLSLQIFNLVLTTCTFRALINTLAIKDRAAALTH